MLIGEVARRAGLTTATLRFYEAERLLSPDRRTRGRRVYTEAAVERLRMIACLQAAGFSLREIRGLLATLELPRGLSRAWHTRAHAKLEELEDAAREIRAARRVLRSLLACGCDSAADCDVIGTWSRGKRPR